MLPLFPSDGGRVLRAVLSMKLGYQRATWWAVRASQFFVIILSITAFYYESYWTGCFVLILLVFAQNELAHTRMLGSVLKMRDSIAEDLNKPELKQASLTEIIKAVEAVEDTNVGKFKKDALLTLLWELEESNIRL